MSRRFALVTVVLVATAAFLVGLDRRRVADAGARRFPHDAADVGAAGRAHGVASSSSLVNFADVAERLNPAVVNIDATSRAAPSDDTSPRRRGTVRARPGSPNRGDELDAASRHGQRRDHRGRRLHPHQPPRHRARRADPGEAGRRPDAARRGRRVSDPDTDIALIKVSSPRTVSGRAARRFRRAARGRVGVRHRQPAGVRAHRHGRRGQLHRPQAVRQAASTTTSRPMPRSTSATAAVR